MTFAPHEAASEAEAAVTGDGGEDTFPSTLVLARRTWRDGRRGLTEGGLMQRFEYTVADFTKLDKARAELNELGAEGWEAVGLVSTWGAGWRMVHPIALLKRPLPDNVKA